MDNPSPGLRRSRNPGKPPPPRPGTLKGCDRASTSLGLVIRDLGNTPFIDQSKAFGPEFGLDRRRLPWFQSPPCGEFLPGELLGQSDHPCSFRAGCQDRQRSDRSLLSCSNFPFILQKNDRLVGGLQGAISGVCWKPAGCKESARN